MIDVAGERLERRLLILAPVGKDAALISSMLARDRVECVPCADPESLCHEISRGASAVLISEEALPRDQALAAIVQCQAPWSDLPVLLLTRPGANSAAVTKAMQTLGNVTLLERPVRVTALASAVRSALRARERQYQTRAHLQEREEADRRKDEFLATLAHELRNPLAPIRNSVNMLRLSGAAQPDGQVWEMMNRQIDHIVRLVDDLMEVSRITRGKIELRTDVVNLAEVIAAAVETSRSLIEAAGHTLSIVVPPEPMVVDADGMRLAQVFSNLLNNATKYTDPGGRISIAAKRDQGTAVVTVSDNGIGIAPEALPRVFDMFVQADARDVRAKTGLGIGLTLARSLVEMHGGTVTASSAGIGRGSEFVVRLPLSAHEVKRVKAGAGATQPIAGLPRIMVVDDNRDAALTLAAVLQLLGAEVRVAHDGVSALDEFGAFRPAAIFLDLGMPGMDGYETAKRIRARSEARDTLIIALTGWGQEKDRRQTEAAGFNHHLVKPADIAALKTVLASLAR
ncbi:MAG TPA: ATP-binding protein [Burkholderiales bacterium]|nr:ATP-binding protein [Burkholderiales bacterium]